MMRVTLLVAFTLSGALAAPVRLEQYRPHDFVFSAAEGANPFDVELWGEFSGPGGARMRIAGFYDGGGVWKIRFSPPAPGKWSLRTFSAIPALDGETVEAEAAPNSNPRAHGVLHVDSEHPFHFRFEDGSRFFLMGYEADWLWGADMLDPSRKVMRRLIAQVAERGFNHVMVNIYAHDTPWCPGKSSDWDYGPAPVYPWAGTNEKPDHSRLNPAFFKIYDGMMDALLENGIVAQLMLKVYNKDVNWPPKGSRDEARYFRYVAARYQAYPNVIWDFSKEARNESDKELERHLIELVRTADTYGHLTTAHDDDPYEWDWQRNRTLDFRTEQKHADYAAWIAFGRAIRPRPVLNAEFGYEFGVDKLPTHTHPNQVDWKTLLNRAYRIYFAGGYAVYYYNNTAWDVVKPDPEPPGMRRWQILKETLSSLPYWRMEPHNELAAGGACLVEPGGTYAFYVPGAGTAVNLRGRGAAATAEWIDTWTGVHESAGTLEPGLLNLQKPKSFGDAPAVLIVRGSERAAWLLEKRHLPRGKPGPDAGTRRTVPFAKRAMQV
jgi:hypothetical protein